MSRERDFTFHARDSGARFTCLIPPGRKAAYVTTDPSGKSLRRDIAQGYRGEGSPGWFLTPDDLRAAAREFETIAREIETFDL